MKLTIGTRGSALALWQARYVAAEIEKSHPGIKVEFRTIKTRGDKILDTPLAKIGGKGLFTKEIEDALLDGTVDLAVHSLKDLPTDLPGGLHVAAIMKREDPRDVFISRDGRTLEELGAGARIGTSSLRRKAFTLNRFPELEVVSIRGNVDTRLRKIETEDLAGIMLAAAGLIRMGLSDRITSYMDLEVMLPAIGQGALAIEARIDDSSTAAALGDLNHPQTAECVKIERAFLQRMGGGCQVPMSAHCVLEGNGVKVMAAVVHPDGNPTVSDTYVGPGGDPRIGTRLADALIEQGAADILRNVLDKSWEPGPAMDIV
jgi:hydroxymethylbilane synthase